MRDEAAVNRRRLPAAFLRLYRARDLDFLQARQSLMATKAKSVGKALEATASKRIRKLFGNIHEAVEMPNLIEVQRESYEQFLRSDPSIGYVSGLEKTLRSVDRKSTRLNSSH